MAERLTAEEARTVTLSWNPFTRRRQIREYAAQIAAGVELLENTRPRYRSGLILLAQSRTNIDVTKATQESATQFTKEIQTSAQQIRETTLGLYSTPGQLELDYGVSNPDGIDTDRSLLIEGE